MARRNIASMQGSDSSLPLLSNASVLTFTRMSERLASLRVGVSGGKLSILTAYAPHGWHGYDVRQRFFQSLEHRFRQAAVHGVTIVLDDMNTWIHHT